MVPRRYRRTRSK
uniref:Uncharacterized protein n=1 Tax=Arundo donax TaxID=35708 RepID=A0A0A8YU71_ARUDO